MNTRTAPRRRAALAAMIAALAAAAAPALAQDGPPHRGMGHGWNPLFAGVTLSDEQKTQIHAIEKSSHQQMRPTFEKLRTLHEQIETALLASGSVDATSLQSLVKQAGDLEQQMAQAHLAAELQERAVLTASQLAEAAQKHQQLAALHEQEHQLMAKPAGEEGPESP